MGENVFLFFLFVVWFVVVLFYYGLVMVFEIGVGIVFIC